MDALISKLLVLMQHPRKIVQEGALTAIAGVADCAQVSCNTSFLLQHRSSCVVELLVFLLE